METYKGKTEEIKGPIITVIVLAVVIFCLLVFVPHGIGLYIAIAFLLMILMFAYKGIVLKIIIDDTKIIIIRPITRSRIKIKNIAFCAVHEIDEEKSIIYSFVKQKYGKTYGVKGVKSKKNFNEIVKLVADDKAKSDLDVNFNKAEKIPVSFVENGEALKQKILDKVSKNQLSIL